MNIQFSRQFLLEDDAYGSLKDMLISLGADEQAAHILIKAVEQGLLTPDKVVSIVRSTATMEEESGTAGAGAYLPSLHATPEKYKGPELEEDDQKKETVEFEVGQIVKHSNSDWKIINKSGEGLNATYTIEQQPSPGIKTRVIHDMLARQNQPKEARVAEDAPMLAAGKADISTYTKDKFTKVPKGHAKLKSIIVKDLWEMTTAVEGEDDEWPKEVLSRHRDMKFVLQKTLPDRATYQIIDLEDNNKPVGNMTFGSVKTLEDFAGDYVKPKGGTRSTQLEGEDLKENYHRFKRETKERPKQDQYHEAIKVVNKKLDEVNRILEFTSRMKNELAEGDGVLEMKANTAKAMDKIKSKIAEAYKKIKTLN